MAPFRTLILATLLALFATSAAAQPLVTDVVPDHYDLRITINFADNSFTGDETILVEVTKPVLQITLHAAGLSFGRAAIAAGTGSQPATISLDQNRETVALSVRRRIPAGSARIRLSYSGRMSRDLRGLYWGQANGRKYAATQFEATYARRLFPCFDQPDLKASFSITAIVPADASAISNSRVLDDTPGPGPRQHTVQFATTKKISSYIVALAVGDFACVDAAPTHADAVPVRACAIRGREERARFGLDAAGVILAYYNKYFTTRFPFGKLDLVAIPEFDGGGMENAGAIFLNEQDLLADAGAAAATSQKRVAMTISHEIAHEWLGDLVTMKWWDDLWLKEGLATWLETRPLAEWKPEWRVDVDEVVAAETAMAADSVESSHPLKRPVNTPAEIEKAYDVIAYNKAAAVVRMVEQMMGRDSFRDAVNAFVKRFAYSNATSEDFRDVLSENSSQVGQVLRGFVEQRGVPAVTLSARCDTTATSVLTLAQRLAPSAAIRSDWGNPAWAIPVSTRPLPAAGARPAALPSPAFPSDPIPGVPATYLLTSREQTFPLAGCNAVVLGNAGAAGYYRTAYAPGVLAQIAGTVETQLTAVERLRLLADQWALVRIGSVDVADYLALVGGYVGDDQPQIVDRINGTLIEVERSLGDGPGREATRQRVQELREAFRRKS